MLRRRRFLGMLPLTLASPSLFAGSEPPIRFGLTPALLHDQHGLLADWREYLERRLGRPVAFVPRNSYRETMDLLRLEKLDFAWISDYPYVHLGKQVRLLAVPIYRGRSLFRAYLIVPASDRHTSSILQLKGRVFAYADPYSNTGYLVPRYQLHQAGEDPARFFRKTFFTYSHRHLVRAIAIGLAHGASVDSYVWDTLSRIQPDVAARTRIAAQSEDFGFPPLVAKRSVSTADFSAMQRVLLGMADDADGRALLARFALDGFSEGDDKLYRGVAEMMRTLGEA